MKTRLWLFGRWQPIGTAPNEVRILGPSFAPGIGGSRTRIMDTDDGVVALRFSRDEGDGPQLKYWMLMPEAPE